MIYKKITEGAVIQEFDEKGNFIRQYFKTGDFCMYVDEKEEFVAKIPSEVLNAYHPFTMISEKEEINPLDRCNWS